MTKRSIADWIAWGFDGERCPWRLQVLAFMAWCFIEYEMIAFRTPWYLCIAPVAIAIANASELYKKWCGRKVAK
jgi:hypothetical protein